MTNREEALIAELKALPDVQQRIDRIAEDIDSGSRKFACIDSSVLGELLGLEFDDSGEWSGRSYWAYRRDMNDEGFSHPFAENLQLLKGLIGERRYQMLSSIAASIEDKPDADDLPLTEKEEALLREKFDEEDACDRSAFVAAHATLESTNGTELVFTALIGDGGECFEAHSPYDENDGIDEATYIQFE
jgi:hypothetical protein